MELFSLLFLFILPFLIYLFLKKPEIIPGLLLLTLPLYLIRFHFFSLSVSFFEIILTLAFLTYFLKNPQELKSVFNFLKKFFQKLPLVAIPFLFFLLFAFVSVFHSPDYLLALKHFKVLFFDPCLFSLLLISILKNKKSLEILNQFVAILIMFLASLAIFEYFINFAPLSPWNNIIEAKRAAFPFPHPNFFTLFTIPFWVYLFCKSFPRFSFLTSLALILGLFALFLTFSLFSLISLILVILCYLIFIKKSFFLPLLISFLVLGFILFLFSTSADFFTLKIFSLDERITLWKGSLNLLAEFSLSGTGLKSFETSYQLFRLPQHLTLNPYPHNLYLALWIETSLGGLISFLIALLLLLVRLLPLKKEAVLNSQFFFPLVVSLVHGMFDTPFFKNDLAIIFFFFVILGVIGLLRKDDHLFDS
jgi:O-antigen ligase